jgi:hypothetical protein
VADTRPLLTVDDFFPTLTRCVVFSTSVSALDGVPRERFVWDYWHVPD